jgi:hypothetical protein
LEASEEHARQSRESERYPRQRRRLALSHVPDKAPVYLHSENMTDKASDGWASAYATSRGRPNVFIADVALERRVAQVGGQREAVECKGTRATRGSRG